MLNPWMLLGLLGLSVPVILHWIQRQQMKPEFLTTLRFLDKEDVANAFSRTPRDLLQLLLRLLLLTAFVMLMTRFTWTTAEVGPRTMALILDDSMSMQRTLPDGRSLFDVHKAQIAELVAGMRDEDRFAFLLVGDEVFTDTGLTGDRAALEAAVAGAQPSDGGGRSLLPAIRGSLEELQGTKAANTAVVVFSDQQRTHFLREEGARAIGDLVGRGRSQLCFVSEPLEPQPNVGVEEAEFHPGRAFMGTSSKVTATLRNWTDGEQPVTVAFKEGLRDGEDRELQLAANDTVQVDLPHAFESPVDAECEVSLSDDGFAADNRFRLPMRMRERRQVLLVAPAKYAPQEGTATRYSGVDLLAIAINPEESLGLPATGQSSLKRVSPEQLDRIPLSSYKVIILYGIAEPPSPTTVADLTGYVRSGGGLWIIPDRDTSPTALNATFAPLLGNFRLAGFREEEKAVFLDTNEATLGHPLLAPLIREEWGSTDEFVCSASFDVGAAGEAACALATRDGRCLAAVIPVGRGRVYVQTFSCGIRDTSLPRTSIFPPMVQAVLDFLAADVSVADRDVIRAGQVHFMDLALFQGLGGNVVVEGPERFEFPLTESGADVRIHGLYRAGAYRVTHPLKKTDRVRWLTVNGDPGESNAVPLSDAERQSVFGERNVAAVPYEGLAGRFTRRRELIEPLCYLLFAFLAIEALAGAWQARRKQEAVA